MVDHANYPKLDESQKDIFLFKSEGFTITINTNLIESCFLYTMFNLATKKFFPHKLHNILLYFIIVLPILHKLPRNRQI